VVTDTVGDLMTDVKWPAADGDLLKPTQEFLQGLAVLESDTDKNDPNAKQDAALVPFKQATTPESLQVITAGSLAFSQQAAKIVTALGGSAAILAAIKAIWFTSTAPVMAAIIGGAAVVLAAVFISLAVIVRSDVQARGTAQAAEYEARGRIASTFLQAAERAHPDSAASGTRQYWLKRSSSQAWHAVDHFETAAGGLVAVLADQGKTVVKAAEINMLEYAFKVS
jgi:uncharacterized protein YaiE (UPF0345 family)